MGQHHDSAPFLSYTVISIDSPHMRKDSSNYLKFLFVSENDPTSYNWLIIVNTLITKHKA